MIHTKKIKAIDLNLFNTIAHPGAADYFRQMDTKFFKISAEVMLK